MARKVWGAKWDILRAGGKVHKLSFVVQNFMDADHLELDRIHACSFMVMTPQGPVSMCMHNAKRDDYILQPLEVRGQAGKVWDPHTGKVRDKQPEKAPETTCGGGGWVAPEKRGEPTCEV